MDESYPQPADLEAFANADSAVNPQDLTVAPDPAPCWAGDWVRVDVRTQVWGQSAVLRTVGALPDLHPWRLGGNAGSIRQVQWTGRPATVPAGVLCVLAVTATEPKLDASDHPSTGNLTGGLLDGAVTGVVADVAARLGAATEQRWAGALVQMPGTWLPAVALLPRGIPGVPSPRTQWDTESVDFDQRWVVHSENEQMTAALLSPSVMSVLLDTVPRGAAVSIAGDALQVWWPYDESTQADLGRVQRAALAALLLVKTFPRFVLTDHPDRGAELERSLARKADEAHDYQTHKSFGRSPDPVLQRIYDQARAGVAVSRD
jgi:hypothetical protein